MREENEAQRTGCVVVGSLMVCTPVRAFNIPTLHAAAVTDGVNVNLSKKRGADVMDYLSHAIFTSLEVDFYRAAKWAEVDSKVGNQSKMFWRALKNSHSTDCIQTTRTDVLFI